MSNTSKKLKYWGWGYAETPLPPNFVANRAAALKAMFGIQAFENVQPLPLADLQLRVPRFELPTAFQDYCTADKYERARHTYGQAFRDIWRAVHGQFDNPPDYVAFPTTEQQISDLMEFATEHTIALVPFGGGSSVCGGVESTRDTHYKGVIIINLKHFNKILEVDKVSRCAKIQAGIFGPALNAGLKKHGLVLRHYPQSFEFSTLGGWIVTRAGGHFATLYTHIDEFVQSLRMVTPQGIMESRRLPGSGAGPSEERFVAGSEGTLGIVTSAWIRLQDIPKYKATVTVRFKTFMDGVNAAKALSQSGLNPANARLIDAAEALSNGLGDGRSTILILGFESHLYPVDGLIQTALTCCEPYGGQWDIKPKTETKRDKKADTWKNSFLLAPYMRDEFVKLGMVVETFETAITWDQFEGFHQHIMKTAYAAIKKHCEGKGVVTCRFTHLYPDGPAPYYTIIAKGKPNQQLQQWDAIKHAVSTAIIEKGGTITHHHAVGKDHQPYYEKQRSAIFGKVLQATKKALDPNWILNPGVLLSEKDRI